MNMFMQKLKEHDNFTYTENGALSHKTTNSAVYDLFALGGAYRNRSDGDCETLFINAYKENPELALKCLFYLRDITSGQGERRFFRVCFRALALYDPEAAIRNLKYIPIFGRWDDVWYSTVDVLPVFEKAMELVKQQFNEDIVSPYPSLLGKWLPSCNASSYKTKKMGHTIRTYLNLAEKTYRQKLSLLRKRLNVLERLISANEWDKIDFSKIPAKAGLQYRRAFLNHEGSAERYNLFMQNKDTKVNAKTLYPYEIVQKACEKFYQTPNLVERLAINKYWENLPDYLNGEKCSMMCVVDTSASMRGTPLNVAISLGMYCAERIGGPFHNHYISFSRNPKLISIDGYDFYQKVRNIYAKNLCENTNLKATFDLLKYIAKTPGVHKEDIPKTLVIISDMQIDRGTSPSYWERNSKWTFENTSTEMELIRKEWAAEGLTLPRLVYWNVDARGEANILDAGPNVSFVSGFSPIIFQSVLTNKSGIDLCLEVLLSDRYRDIA